MPPKSTAKPFHHSLREIERFTGFDRGTMRKRLVSDPGDEMVFVKDVLQLIPLSNRASGETVGLEEARIRQTIADARCKELQADKMEGSLCDIDYVLGIINTFHDFLIAGIKQSNIPDEEKEDLLGSIVDFARKLGDEGLIE